MKNLLSSSVLILDRWKAKQPTMHTCHSQSASEDFLFDMTLKSCLNLKICVSQWSMKMKLKKEDQPPKVISLCKHYFRWFVVERSFPTKCYYWLKLSQIQQLTSDDFRISWARLQAFLPLGFPVQGTHGTWDKHRVVEALNTGIKHITVISLVLSGTLSVKRCKKYESNTPVLFQRSNSVEISVHNIDDSWAVCLGGSVDEILWAGRWVKTTYTNIWLICILYNI